MSTKYEDFEFKDFISISHNISNVLSHSNLIIVGLIIFLNDSMSRLDSLS
jgi:hypothetical protein